MKSIPLRAVLCLTLLLICGVQAQEVSLFNGRDLTSWSGNTKFWSVEDGAITGKLTKKNSGGAVNNFLIWQGGNVADFELTLKYKLTPDNDDGMAVSGVQFRANYTDRAKFQLHGYQGRLAQLGAPNADPNLANGCLREDGHPSGILAQVGQKVVIHQAPLPADGPQGTIQVVGSLAPDDVYQKLYHPGEWNDYRIVVSGNHIQIFVNGQQTVAAIDEVNRATTGFIGLQLHCFDKKHKTVQFKDIKLRVLKAGAETVAAKPELRPPRIEELRDQAQNAIEWALAPLDRPLPSDIRQNLIYLREDLLDEAKVAPQAGANAYALGSVLCAEILGTIAERSETSARAGYSAAQANADVYVDSQSLSARRNYKMSWTQYAREQNERAEILRQQTGAADLKKERIKVDWTTRTEALRKSLNDLYGKFREALRQSAPPPK